jgi:hypothetical protein
MRRRTPAVQKGQRRAAGTGASGSVVGESRGETAAGRFAASWVRAQSSCFLWEGLDAPQPPSPPRCPHFRSGNLLFIGVLSAQRNRSP